MVSVRANLGSMGAFRELTLKDNGEELEGCSYVTFGGEIFLLDEESTKRLKAELDFIKTNQAVYVQ